MASFLEDLWNSVFTPGPTPTLLYATNITFGALLMLLLVLLISTWSIHFFILSILSAGLWGAINWFASEIRKAQAEEENAIKKGDAPVSQKVELSQDISGDAMDSGDDTETEIEDRRRQRDSTPQILTPMQTSFSGSVNETSKAPGTQGFTTHTTGTVERLAPDANRQVRQRQRQSMAESTGSLSTDSEWEKVDENDNH